MTDLFSAPDTANPPNGLKIAALLRMPLQANLPVPTYYFLSTLNLFAAALLSHYTNLKALHYLNAQHRLRNSRRFLPIKVPSIYLKLSQIIPSKNRASRTGKPWAIDIVKLTFTGLETSPPSPKPIQSPPNPSNLPTPSTQNQSQVQHRPTLAQDKAVVVTEARIVIPDRSALSLLAEKFDKDIAFDNKSGSFAIRIRSAVGESIIRPLVENLNRIEKFVEFINVLDKHKDALHSETPSLNKIVFTYGPLLAAIDADNNIPRPYRATITFGALNSPLALEFDNANPHLRIADFLTRVLNAAPGLDSVATLLPMTQPTLSALDTIERNWLPLSDRGSVTVFVRATEWYIIRYLLLPPAGTPDAPPRRISFEAKIQSRKGEAWWYVRRSDGHDGRDKDEVDAALKAIWNSKGLGWDGMRVSAVARPAGANDLFAKIDEVMRTVDLSKPLPAPVAPVAPMQQAQIHVQTQPQGQVQGQKAGNRAQMPQQQQRQQPTPNHSQNQNQNQGRHNNSLKREIVEID
jgi:mediator of RNA polymerase II transcription subunit 14